MSRQNWEKAKEYLPEILENRKLEFYRKVRDLTHLGNDDEANELR
jgi:hypothetical protein